MRAGTTPKSVAGKAWSFLRAADFRGLRQAVDRRWPLVKRVLTGPIGPGAMVLDPQTDLALGQASEIEESVDPSSVSPTSLAVHLAPYRFASPYVLDKEVLEVGCNWGYGSHLLAQHARRVVGLDVNHQFVSYGRQRFTRDNLQLIVHDANNPFPFSSQSFDIVFSSEVIEHIANYSGCLHEMCRMLKPTGILILKTPNLAYARRWHALNPYHLKVFLPRELREVLMDQFGEVEMHGFAEQYEHSIRRVENVFDPFSIPFDQKIPGSCTIELQAWVEPKLVAVEGTVPPNLLVICRRPKQLRGEGKLASAVPHLS
jgi:2-polyprenyl-3-methyl-5-hydroxy-6-metoxy-1,4-benzoquinol methylase